MTSIAFIFILIFILIVFISSSVLQFCSCFDSSATSVSFFSSFSFSPHHLLPPFLPFPVSPFYFPPLSNVIFALFTYICPIKQKKNEWKKLPLPLGFTCHCHWGSPVTVFEIFFYNMNLFCNINNLYRVTTKWLTPRGHRPQVWSFIFYHLVSQPFDVCVEVSGVMLAREWSENCNVNLHLAFFPYINSLEHVKNTIEWLLELSWRRRRRRS